MLALNIPDKYAQARGGWSTNHTMKTVYQHAMASKRTYTYIYLDGYFYQLLEGRTAGPPAFCVTSRVIFHCLV